MSVSNQERPVLTNKQQQEYEKQCFEIHRHNTDVYNSIFEKTLKVVNLHVPAREYSEVRTERLYWEIRRLSREKMSVMKIHRFLEIIFEMDDLIAETNEDKKYSIIHDKLKFLCDLGESTKLSVHELLKFASKKICT